MTHGREQAGGSAHMPHIPAMRHAQPPSLALADGLPPASFAAWDAARTRTAVKGDISSFVLGVLINLAALHSLNLDSRGRSYLACLSVIYLRGLWMCVCHPEPHRVQRPQWAALQFTMAALCPAIMNISAAMDPPAPAAAPLASLAQLAFLLLLMRCFWIGSVLTAGMIQPTPAVLLAVQLLTVAATTGSVAASCSSQFMQHPLTAGRVDALYSWLEPGIVLAQPLLLLTAAGRRAEGAAWRCMSVHVGLIAWGALLATAAIFSMQLRDYRQLKQKQQQYRQAAGISRPAPLEPGEWQLAVSSSLAAAVWARLDRKWLGVAGAFALQLWQLRSMSSQLAV